MANRSKAKPGSPPKVPKKPVHSDGSRRLSELLDKGVLRANIAEALGVEWTTVHRWANGERTPSGEYVGKLEALYNIPARLWGEGRDRKAAA